MGQAFNHCICSVFKSVFFNRRLPCPAQKKWMCMRGKLATEQVRAFLYQSHSHAWMETKMRGKLAMEQTQGFLFPSHSRAKPKMNLIRLMDLKHREMKRAWKAPSLIRQRESVKPGAARSPRYWGANANIV